MIEDRLKLEWHQALLRGENAADHWRRHWSIPVFTMLLLQLDHIGQVQCGVWPAQVRERDFVFNCRRDPLTPPASAAGRLRNPVSKRQI